jgi:murein DD-endopeptidase MepM/ murein hydrolase activator NlpD
MRDTEQERRNPMKMAIKTAGPLVLLALFVFLIPAPCTGDTDGESRAMIEKSLGSFLREGIKEPLSLEEILIQFNIPLGTGPKDIAATLVGIGKEEYSKGEVDKATSYFKQALTLLNESRERKVLGDTLQDLGLFFKTRDDKVNALEYLERAVDVSLLTVDDDKLEDLLKVLEDLFGWQETVGSDPSKPPMPEAPPEGPPKKPSKKPSKKPAKKPSAEAKPGPPVKEISGGVLPCRGPAARNKAYADIAVKKEWAARFLNPVPHGKYAPYATDSGLDIIAARGHPIYASKAGVILYSAPYGHVRQKGPEDDQGAMRIRHPDGTDTFYAHLSGRRADFKAGTRIRQGQWMGNVGRANRVPHLHFTIYFPGGRYEGPFSTPKKLLNPWPPRRR